MTVSELLSAIGILSAISIGLLGWHQKNKNDQILAALRWVEQLREEPITLRNKHKDELAE